MCVCVFVSLVKALAYLWSVRLKLLRRSDVRLFGVKRARREHKTISRIIHPTSLKPSI